MIWYGTDGQFIDSATADSLLRDDLARRVTHTTLVTDKGRVTISTVFLVLDHNFSGGPPVLWETMVFDGPLDQHCDRYNSVAMAKAGHAETVALVRSALDVDGAVVLAEETLDGPAGDLR